MKEEDNLDENLDEFIIRLSNALYQKNNPEISLILNSLKEYLLSIYQDKPEMENFFKTLPLPYFYLLLLSLLDFLSHEHIFIVG